MYGRCIDFGVDNLTVEEEGQESEVDVAALEAELASHPVGNASLQLFSGRVNNARAVVAIVQREFTLTYHRFRATFRSKDFAGSVSCTGKGTKSHPELMLNILVPSGTVYWASVSSAYGPAILQSYPALPHRLVLNATTSGPQPKARLQFTGASIPLNWTEPLRGIGRYEV